MIIITRGSFPSDEGLPDSTTKNAEAVQFCEAREEGVVCPRHASHIYTDHEDIPRNLCDFHWRRLLRLINAWHSARRETGDVA